jgi:hypothetical protein
MDGGAQALLLRMREEGEEAIEVAFDGEIEAPPPLTRACQTSRASSYFFVRREGWRRF